MSTQTFDDTREVTHKHKRTISAVVTVQDKTAESKSLFVTVLKMFKLLDTSGLAGIDSKSTQVTETDTKLHYTFSPINLFAPVVKAYLIAQLKEMTYTHNKGLQVVDSYTRTARFKVWEDRMPSFRFTTNQDGKVTLLRSTNNPKNPN